MVQEVFVVIVLILEIQVHDTIKENVLQRKQYAKCYVHWAGGEGEVMSQCEFLFLWSPRLGFVLLYFPSYIQQQFTTHSPELFLSQ